MAQLHIRFEGQSVDVEMAEVDLGDLSTEVQIKQAAANALSVPVVKFAAFAIDKNPDTGDVTLRPQAVFG